MRIICGIYKITNKITKKVYIEQSIDIKRRWWEHKSRAFDKQNNCYDKPLYRSFRKYGISNFEIEVVCECDCTELNEKEIEYITLYNSLVPNGYNILNGTDKLPNTVEYCKNCGRVIVKGTKYSLCSDCFYIFERKVDRPTKEVLYDLLCESGNFEYVGSLYGVSGNAIRKWCRSYEIPSNSFFYRNMQI